MDLDEIDFETEVEGPVGVFLTAGLDSAETVARWRETTCEQALFYRENRDRFISQYAGEFIMLQEGDVIWHGPDASALRSRRELSGRNKDSAIFLKLVDPEEVEGERFEVYERELARMRGQA